MIKFHEWIFNNVSKSRKIALESYWFHISQMADAGNLGEEIQARLLNNNQAIFWRRCCKYTQIDFSDFLYMLIKFNERIFDNAPETRKIALESHWFHISQMADTGYLGWEIQTRL